MSTHRFERQEEWIQSLLDSRRRQGKPVLYRRDGSRFRAFNYTDSEYGAFEVLTKDKFDELKRAAKSRGVAVLEVSDWIDDIDWNATTDREVVGVE